MILLLVLVSAAVISAALIVAGLVWRKEGRRSAKWISAGGVVIDERGQVALVRQRDRKGRWRWTLPKGRMEPGETAERTALREVYEETGLRARIVKPIVLHEGRMHFTCFFEMSLEHDDGIHDRETREVRFVPVSDAVALLRSRRDLHVLRRLVEVGMRVVVAASPRNRKG